MPTENWEKEFNEKFTYMESSAGKLPAKFGPIKSFISQLLQKTREDGVTIQDKLFRVAVHEERERILKIIEEMEKEPTKHEGHELDPDQDCCYTCHEIIEEGTRPNGAIAYNHALQDLKNKIKEV